MTFDVTNCVVKATNFGETVVTNVCTGIKTIVPWGSMDFIGPVTVLGIATMILVLSARIAFAKIKVEKVKK